MLALADSDTAVGALTQMFYMFKENMLLLTCIGLQILWSHHDNKADCPFIAKHLISPTADRAHTFDCSNAIVSNKHLKK